MLWRPALAALGMGATLWRSQPPNVWVALPLGGAAYLAGLLILGEHRQSPYPELLLLLKQRLAFIRS